MFGDSRWPVPPDPDRPPCPYFSGFTANIKPHTPPDPFGQKYPKHLVPRNLAPRDWCEHATQTQTVLNYPPVERNAEEIAGVGATLTISKSVAVGNGRHTQLVLCDIAPNNALPFKAFAKIYDGLYYPFRNYGDLTDVCYCSDKEYSREAAAYEQLRSRGLIGDFTPDFYGCWTMSMPLRHEGLDHIRQVRLILLEAVDGQNMESLSLHNSPYPGEPANPYHYPEKMRLGVLEKILEGETRQIHAGVEQRDVCPSNILIVNPHPFSTTISRVVLVDYHIAAVFPFSAAALWPKWEKAALPKSPKWRHWRSGLEYFGEWIPENWRGWNSKPQRTWLDTTFGRENAVKYETIRPTSRCNYELESEKEEESVEEEEDDPQEEDVEVAAPPAPSDDEGFCEESEEEVPAIIPALSLLVQENRARTAHLIEESKRLGELTYQRTHGRPSGDFPELGWLVKDAKRLDIGDEMQEECAVLSKTTQ